MDKHEFRWVIWRSIVFRYLLWFIDGKYPRILYIKVSDKIAYANSADPDQTAPEGAVWSGSALFAIALNILWKKSKI